MKNKILIGLAAILLVVSTAAQADHDDPIGSVGLLQFETEELDQAVRTSWLRYSVKQAVFRFASDVNRLANCVKFGPRPIINDHLDEPGVPRRCSRGLYRTKSSFRSVDRYLYDTAYDFPRIYRIYREVRRALRAVYVNGPGPAPIN